MIADPQDPSASGLIISTRRLTIMARVTLFAHRFNRSLWRRPLPRGYNKREKDVKYNISKNIGMVSEDYERAKDYQ